MKYSFSRTVVITLGGSIVHPDGVNTPFLKKFAPMLRSYLKTHRFVIVVGGGKIARVMQDAAGQVAKVTDEDKDWLGIHSTRLNAHLLRTIFRDVADPVIIDRRHRLDTLSKPITIAAGWRPGASTDYVGVALAQDFGTAEVIIAGRPAFVYDRDPESFGTAKAIPEISWKEYRRLLPQKWTPGLHAPVDPVAAKLAEAQGVKAIVVDGTNLSNFKSLLEGRAFKGSIIQ